MKPTRINLSDWYTTEEARARLSANSGREIHASYPHTLARLGSVRSLKISTRAKLYFKQDIDAYVVSDQRGRKPSKPKEPRTTKQADAKRCEKCGRESDDLDECDGCGKLCCELCISGQYQNFDHWNGNVDFVMKCQACAGRMPALAI